MLRDDNTVVLNSVNNSIVTFGDSTTAARMINGQPLTVYTDLLRMKLPLQQITSLVINKGVPGDTTQGGIARFEVDILFANPCLVIIQFGINDSAVDVWRTPQVMLPRVSLEQYTLNLTAMVQQLKIRGVDIILMTPNPILWTAELLVHYGKPPYNPNVRMGFSVLLKDYAQAIRNIARKEQLTMVDVYNLYIAYDHISGHRMEDLLLDGMHPNNHGHELVADVLMSTIISKL